jgi:predicted dithiol-disulfide oxidoreductase (DUF899 family)
MKKKSINPSNVVSPAAWLAALRELLREEKEFTRLRDRLSARRRELPWVKLEQSYTFDSAGGRVSLAELFEERSQLLVYHFMLAPGWDEGCRHCSYVADHFDGTLPHLAARDVSFVAVSRAPLDQILRFKERMGWDFNWVSSHETSFNYDFRVSFTAEEVESGRADYNFGMNDVMDEEMPGLSVFALGPDGRVYRTYSTYSRGIDLIIGTFNFLDLVPKGRDEEPGAPMSWVRHHDRYDHVALAK